MEDYSEFEVVATKLLTTRWTLKAHSESQALQFVEEVITEGYVELGFPDAPPEYKVSKIRCVGKHKPTYVINPHRYFLEIENFEVDYAEAQSVFASSLDDVRTIYKILYGEDVDTSACYALRKLDTFKFAFTDDRGITDVFESTNINLWIRDFVN